MRFERESKARTKALAPYRSGAQGELRAQVRCMLVRLMGFAHCDDIPVGIRKIPHWFPGRSGLEAEEMLDLAAVAGDGLHELGYEAAAELLMRYVRRGGGSPPYMAQRIRQNVEVGARSALENLESGPPSVMIDIDPIITKSIRHYKPSGGQAGEYLVGKHVENRRWYRFRRGKPVHNRRGEWVGWDLEAGYTFERRGDSLADVLAGKYGSITLA